LQQPLHRRGAREEGVDLTHFHDGELYLLSLEGTIYRFDPAR
jgi:hypothetical protein